MNKIKTWRFVVLYILLGLAAVYVHTRSEASVPVNTPLDLFPQRAGEWSMTGQARFDSRVLAVLLPTDYLSRSYENKQGDRVSLYIGYHDGGPKSGPIHSPKQCLPGSGWNRLYDEARFIDADGYPVDYVSSVYQKDSQRQMFLYWFQVRDQMLTNEYALKLAMAKNSFLSNRRDSSFIRLSVMIRDDEDKARLVGEDFIAAFLPAIQESLPR